MRVRRGDVAAAGVESAGGLLSRRRPGVTRGASHAPDGGLDEVPTGGETGGEGVAGVVARVTLATRGCEVGAWAGCEGDSAPSDDWVWGPLAQPVIAQPWLSAQHSSWWGEPHVGQTAAAVSSLIGKRQYGHVLPAISGVALIAQSTRRLVGRDAEAMRL